MYQIFPSAVATIFTVDLMLKFFAASICNFCYKYFHGAVFPSTHAVTLTHPLGFGQEFIALADAFWRSLAESATQLGDYEIPNISGQG